MDDTTTRIEDCLRDADVVFDASNVRDALDRSWQVLKKARTLTSLARQPPKEQANAYSVHALFFIVEPNCDELTRIGELIDAQQLRPVVGKVLPL